jgi:hypothetical protein
LGKILKLWGNRCLIIFPINILKLEKFQGVTHRRIRHLEHDLRDITARCSAERERRMSLEALVGGEIFTVI